jgi:hypothetical protein
VNEEDIAKVCAWCGKVLEGDPDTADAVSHGICKPCLEEAKEEARKELRGNPDERFRELERRAATGDPEAARRFAREVRKLSVGQIVPAPEPGLLPRYQVIPGSPEEPRMWGYLRRALDETIEVTDPLEAFEYEFSVAPEHRDWEAFSYPSHSFRTPDWTAVILATWSVRPGEVTFWPNERPFDPVGYIPPHLDTVDPLTRDILRDYEIGSNPDERTRVLERRYKETGDAHDGAAWLMARVRACDLDLWRVRLAAVLRYQPAVVAMRTSEGPRWEPRGFPGTIEATLVRLHREVGDPDATIFMAKLSIAVARTVSDLLHLGFPSGDVEGDYVAEDILDTAGRWLRAYEEFADEDEPEELEALNRRYRGIADGLLDQYYGRMRDAVQVHREPLGPHMEIARLVAQAYLHLVLLVGSTGAYPAAYFTAAQNWGLRWALASEVWNSVLEALEIHVFLQQDESPRERFKPPSETMLKAARKEALPWLLR